MAVNADTEPIPTGFDPKWLEPLDSRGYLVDMNWNTVRDTRDSIAQAWRRRMTAGKKYGVLEYNEPFTHTTYVKCVTAVATDLSERRPSKLTCRGGLCPPCPTVEDRRFGRECRSIPLDAAREKSHHSTVTHIEGGDTRDGGAAKVKSLRYNTHSPHIIGRSYAACVDADRS
jgi:hypothetical protein